MIIQYVGSDGVCRTTPRETGKRLLREGFLVVDGEVADLKDLILVAGSTEHQADELHENEGHQCRPADHPQSRSELFPQLVGVPRVHEPGYTEWCTSTMGR